jgi:integral membrane sensor domain MASE1
MLSLSRFAALSKVLVNTGSEETHQLHALNHRAQRFLRIFATALLVGLGYYVGTLVGFSLTPKLDPISTFWPPNAVLLAGLLLVPRRQWWTLLIAVLPFHLIAQLPHRIPFSTSLGWYIGNTGEALLGAILITALYETRYLFNQVRGLIVFLICGVFGAPLITSFLDAAVVVATGFGQGYWLLWTTRLFSNMVGSLTIVPTIVLFCLNGPQWFRTATLSKFVEAALLAMSVALVGVYAFAFGVSDQVHIRFFYMLLPVLLWASLRFGVGSLSASLLTISVISIWAVVHGKGLFLSLPLIANVLSLQIFLCMVALPFMFLGVAFAQQIETERSLRDSKTRLIDSQEQERRRIARELHDGVGQSLALLEIELSQLELGSEPHMQARLQNAVQQVSEISSVAREISHGLHPSHLEYLGLTGALNKLCRDFSRDRSLNVRFVHADLPGRLNPEVSLSL